MELSLTHWGSGCSPAGSVKCLSDQLHHHALLQLKGASFPSAKGTVCSCCDLAVTEQGGQQGGGGPPERHKEEKSEGHGVDLNIFSTTDS